MKHLKTREFPAIEARLRSGDFLKALGLLRLIRPESLDSELLPQFYSLSSRALWLSGDYEGALSFSHRCLSSMPDRDCVDYALQKRRQGEILQQLGRLTEATEAFSESYLRLCNLGAYDTAPLPLDSLASLHHLRGDYKAVVRILQQEIEHCLKYNLADDIPWCRVNQGRVLVKLGDMIRAITVLKAVIATGVTKPLHFGATYLLGMIAVFQREGVQAELLLKRSLDYYRRTGSAREEVICLEYLGLNEHFAGNQKAARRYFEGILAREQITASARAQTLRMLTDVLIAEERYYEAREVADQAEAAIGKINERIEAGCLGRSRMRLALGTGDHHAARRHFASSVEMLQLIGARYELAETYLVAGRAEFLDPVSRREFLKQATYLFVTSGVTAQASVAATAMARLLPQTDTPEDISLTPLAITYVACQLMPTS